MGGARPPRAEFSQLPSSLSWRGGDRFRSWRRMDQHVAAVLGAPALGDHGLTSERNSGVHSCAYDCSYPLVSLCFLAVLARFESEWGWAVRVAVYGRLAVCGRLVVLALLGRDWSLRFLS